MIRYKQAPLPFQGQKRNFITAFGNEIKELPDDTVFVDLFGGSGLLSRTVKDTKPTSRVIYNDFDGFSSRLKNIEHTNTLLNEIRSMVTTVPKEKMLPSEVKSKVLLLIEQYDNNGYVDYITLSSSILFSMNYANNLDELKKMTLYNNVIKGNYKNATEYLHGLEIRRCDYRELFAEFRDDEKAFFICDPPYLSTDATSYETYWKLSDYLAVMDCLKETRFAFFTSEKSTLIELLQWLEESFALNNPFAKAKKHIVTVGLNKNAKYNDIMIFKAD